MSEWRFVNRPVIVGITTDGQASLLFQVLPPGDTKVGQLESQDVLLRRIDEASKYVPVENLSLSPQCGFASTEEGNVLTEDQQWAKLGMAAEIAREVWG